MPKAKENKLQFMIAVLLGIAGLVILLIFLVIRSQAEETETSADINNAPPEIITLQIGTTSGGSEVTNHAGTSTVNLTEGTTTTLYVNRTFQDPNGCEEVTLAPTNTAVPVFMTNIWRDSFGPPTDTIYYRAQTYADTGEYSSFYDGGCTFSDCSGASDILASYECVVNMEYFADNTTTDSPKGLGESEYWFANVFINDHVAVDTGEDSATTTFEVALLTAVDAGASINYGSLSVGETSATTSLTITNTGNDNTTDLDMIGTDMTCTTGTIAVTEQKYGTSSAVLGNTLTLTSSTVFDFNLAKQTVTSTLSTNTIDFLVTATEASAGSLAGSCTGTNTIYATPY